MSAAAVTCIAQVAPPGAPKALPRAQQAEAAAGALYERGYHCSEAVVKAINDLAGHPLPPEVMRLASGFCAGIGGSRCTCGALAGAVMAVGLLSGRSGPNDPWEPAYDGAAELRRRFVQDQGAQSCDEVVGRIGDMQMPERWAHCTLLVGRCARWVVEIAEECGWPQPARA